VAGAGHDKWAEPKGVRQGQRAADKDAVFSDVKRRPAIIRRRIVLVGDEIGRTRGDPRSESGAAR
jgi:hypothetical protein